MTDIFDGLTRLEPHDYVVLVIRVIETITVPVFPVFVALPKSMGGISTTANFTFPS